MDRRISPRFRPSAAVVWAVGCTVVGLGWALRSAGGPLPDAESWWLALVLVAVALMHAEATRPPQERRRVAHLAVERVDHGAAWVLGGALVLPTALALVPAIVVTGRGLVVREGGRHVVDACTLIAAAVAAHTVAVASPAREWVVEGTLPPATLAVAAMGLAGAVAAFWLVWRVIPGAVRALRGTVTWTRVLSDGDLLVVLALGVIAAWSAGVGHGAPLVAVAAVATGVTRRTQRIAELARERDRFEADALHDPLTGLANQRGFNPAAALALVADQARRRPTAVLMLDLDGFRQVNARLGHLGANEVLKSFATLLRGMVRRDDLVCRWGGEEFSLVLPGTGRSDAWAVAERIRRAVEAMTVELTPTRGAGIERVGQFTVSGGIAVSPTDGTDLATLQTHADDALAEAKAGGRNQIRLTPAPAEVDSPH
ncbi:GGDEF domain-containing protein [Actinokineospora fastidiosa]|uniref:GGDEF domain-containing protein n=1 Tax=Actinokineospora fastidiosa TaxID=1816 RepID=UPI00167103CA|nr:GGDEF domain-containing protein [Actinokineospora fastidiosa]